MTPPCVIKNHNGKTALYINKGTKHSWYIPMDSGGLTVVKQPHKQVLDEWNCLSYPINYAAQKFWDTPFSKTELVLAILEKLLENDHDFNALD